MAADTCAAGGAFWSAQMRLSVAIAVGVASRASSCTSAMTFGRPVGLPDCPGLNRPDSRRLRFVVITSPFVRVTSDLPDGRLISASRRAFS